MNMVALDFKDDCLSNAIADPALLHAVLYIVASDYDLKQGEPESALSKYHGGEAVRLINKHLDGVLTDTIVAAIAIMATREVCLVTVPIQSGVHDFAKAHICRILMADSN